MKKSFFFTILVLCIFVSAFMPVGAKAFSDPPPAYEIKSQTAVLMDAKTGSVLYNKDMDKQMYPASITKIMTAMLALEVAQESTVMTASDYAVRSIGFNTSHIALSPGEQLTFKDAMYALGIESANDAAIVIAENTYGSAENFASAMTLRAKAIGAVNTNFTNPHGLPDDNHYTTAYDMALITSYAIKNPDFCKYFNTVRYDMPTTNVRDVQRQFWNANYFVNGFEDCEGLLMSKTGWTEEAEHTLVTVCERNGVTLIAVVMYSEQKNDKYKDTQALFDWGFENYKTVSVEAGQILDYIPKDLKFEDGSAVECPRENFLTEGVNVLLDKDQTVSDITAECTAPKKNMAGDTATMDVKLYRYSGGVKEYAGKQTVTLLLETSEVTAPKQPSVFDKIIFWALTIFLWIIIVLLVIICIRQIIIMEDRRRKKRRRNGVKIHRIR